MKELQRNAIELLKQLISIQSYSGEEDKTADVIEEYLKAQGFDAKRKKNNVWAWAGERDASKPTILLNSHHDTVKASSKWSYDPFSPTVGDGKLIGLGSNDAGGASPSGHNVNAPATSPPSSVKSLNSLP